MTPRQDVPGSQWYALGEPAGAGWGTRCSTLVWISGPRLVRETYETVEQAMLSCASWSTEEACAAAIERHPA